MRKLRIFRKLKQLVRKRGFLLLALFLVILSCPVFLIWKEQKSVSENLEADDQNYDEKLEKDQLNLDTAVLGTGEQKGTKKQDVHTVYRQNGVCLVDQDDKVIFGPCQYIYDDDIYHSDFNQIFRFIGENGLIGYAATNGEELVPPKFAEASRMIDGSACVKEKGDDNFYYIDSQGNRFTNGSYIQAFPFGEAQGILARAQKEDGTWCLINRQEKILLDGYEKINELPYVEAVATGILNGHAVLLNTIDGLGEKEPQIIREYAKFTDISAPDGDFARVWNQEGKQGLVVVWNGEILVDAAFEEIQISLLFPSFEPDWNQQTFLFRCRKEDGSWIIKKWDR